MNDVTNALAKWDFAATSRTRIVAVEGLDGSGKTTFASGLVGYLNDAGIPTGTARLPTDVARNLPMFETFRQIKPDYDPDGYDPLAMQVFLMADRLHYMRTAFNRLSQQYSAVVFDRYLLSGAAHLVVDGHPIGGWFKDLCSYLPQPAEMFYLRAPYDVAR